VSRLILKTPEILFAKTVTDQFRLLSDIHGIVFILHNRAKFVRVGGHAHIIFGHDLDFGFPLRRKFLLLVMVVVSSQAHHGLQVHGGVAALLGQGVIRKDDGPLHHLAGDTRLDDLLLDADARDTVIVRF
jgi:hypothetical protein